MMVCYIHHGDRYNYLVVCLQRWLSRLSTVLALTANGLEANMLTACIVARMISAEFVFCVMVV
jgi:hypothetical protein